MIAGQVVPLSDTAKATHELDLALTRLELARATLKGATMVAEAETPSKVLEALVDRLEAATADLVKAYGRIAAVLHQEAA